MKELRLTFYDLRGYFVPGSTLLAGLVVLYRLYGEPLPIELTALQVADSVTCAAAVICSYILGHLLHAIANHTIDHLPFCSYPPKNYYKRRFYTDFPPESRQALLNKASVAIAATEGIDGTSESILRAMYWPCFQAVMAGGSTETENFLSLTGFYRGMSAAFICLAVGYLYCGIIYSDKATIFGVAFLIAAILFLIRAGRFNYYLVKTVYCSFLSTPLPTKHSTLTP